MAQSLSSNSALVTPAGRDSGLSKRRNFQSVVELRSRRREGLGGGAELPGTRAWNASACSALSNERSGTWARHLACD